jgi:hypothetical protein
MAQPQITPPADAHDADATASRDAFSDTQLRMLKFAVTAMGVLLVAGVLALIGRIAYLAQRGTPPATTATGTAATKLMAETRVTLPAGAALKSSTLAGDRLVVTYSDAAGDGLIITDLTTGQVLSRVRIERGQ